jgi:serine/threonine-protein kinase RsbW
MNAAAGWRFRAHMDDLQAALAVVEDFCALHGVAAGDALRLRLVLEELFTNTVMHGHRGDCDAPVQLQLRVDVEVLHLDYADDAPPFDPRQYLQTAPREPDLDRERLGGHGLRLVAELVAGLDHAYQDGLNRIRLVLKRRG